MSILNVNKINPVGGGSTITIAGIASVTNNISVGNSVTAGSFVGPIEGAVTGNVTGNVTGDATGLSGNPSINTTGIVTATSFVPTVGQLSHRNIIVNGAMLVAQYGSSSTSTGYQTVDRMKSVQSAIDEVATQSQSDVASGTTPYTLGFRKAFKFTNGNQTSGAGSGDVIRVQQRLEAQDIANSGWNFLSSSSYLTMSFWVKSSVAQNFYIQLVAYDNATYNYTFETGSLTADTWTKVTHSIPGNSNIRFDNDNGLGLDIIWYQFQGTDRTASDFALNTWAAYASGSQSPDMTSTWYTTNAATFEITGLQLEVGPVATPFEHRSYGEELMRCMRYYETNNYTTFAKNTDGSITSYWSTITSNDSNTLVVSTGIVYKVPKRASPTVTLYNSANTTTANRVNAQGTERTVTATYGGPNALTRIYVSGASSGNYVTYNWEASSEL